MWGTLLKGLLLPLAERFIPTYVGNTAAIREQEITVAVHPHVCGEHKLDGQQLCWHSGSSPRMWGTRVYKLHHLDRVRFIPTYVGNTL